MTAICQSGLPYDVDVSRRLPGTAPLNPADWMITDDAFAEQMAERTRLIETRPDEVIATTAGSEEAQSELLEVVLASLPNGYDIDHNNVLRPDGVRVSIDRPRPLETLGRLVQCDFCLMQKGPDDHEHILTAAVLCFPASWRLSEKIGRPLGAIHAPVEDYDEHLARRVQRLFDGLQVGRPIWRFNLLRYDDPALFQPRSELSPRAVSDKGQAGYLRSERQCLLRLPVTGAVVFSIHTFVVPV